MSLTSSLYDKEWLSIINQKFNATFFDILESKLKQDLKSHKIYPPQKDIFNALNFTSLNNVKVVIIGQDPYHGFGQAHGLAFSVKNGCPIPPSLRNIFQELKNDLGIIRQNGDLTDWAKQGVLLLNSTLTVNEGIPNSHSKYGWIDLTDYIIKTISDRKENVVFVLLGAFAQSKLKFINIKKHIIIKLAHPSPLSAHKGFLGSKLFSNINASLPVPIVWDHN